tara:strand:+ start:103 stop:306 length:204 start_codon:yes stop_codon:yes gene_type:complete
MKVGDLVEVLYEHDLGLVMSEPELSKDCLPGGEAYPHEHYYLVDILYPHGLIRSDYDDVMRVVSEAG